jgi:hypothetical protein
MKLIRLNTPDGRPIQKEYPGKIPDIVRRPLRVSWKSPGFMYKIMPREA